MLFLLLLYVIFSGGGHATPGPSTSHNQATQQAFPLHSPLNPDWRGNGKAVTLGFGGDVHFAGAVGTRLASNPATALGDTFSQLFLGTQLRMVNLETSVTDGTCPQPQNKPYIFDAPASAITALRSALVTVATQANDHGMDCGTTGLAQNLTIAAQDKFPIIGIGNNAAQAFAPYRAKIHGQRIAIISATQVIAANLVSTWSATTSQPGVAAALDPTELITAVQRARRTADTVVVYLHWGTEVQACPNPQQEPLAQQLVTAGADIIIGGNAHVILGGGYLGSAYVDYGLGNFAFYDNSAPETSSGSLIITAVGRKITAATFRPATILAGLPQPLTGAPAATALQTWNSARSCTNLASTPTTSLASERGETSPFIAPTAPGGTTAATTTAPVATGATSSSSISTTTSAPAGAATTTSTTTTPPTTTAPTDNAG